MRWLLVLVLLVSCAQRSGGVSGGGGGGSSGGSGEIWVGHMLDQKFMVVHDLHLQINGDHVVSNWMGVGKLTRNGHYRIALGVTFQLQEPWAELEGWINPVTGDLEGQWTRYRWTFSPESWGQFVLRRKL